MKIQTILSANYTKRFLNPSIQSSNINPVILDDLVGLIDNPESLKDKIKTAGQDSIIVIENLEQNPNQLLVAVADGHGAIGERHSYESLRILPQFILEKWKLIKNHLENDERDIVNDRLAT